MSCDLVATRYVRIRIDRDRVMMAVSRAPAQIVWGWLLRQGYPRFWKNLRLFLTFAVSYLRSELERTRIVVEIKDHAH